MDEQSHVSRGLGCALLVAGIVACEPNVTIADDTSDARKGGTTSGKGGGASSGAGAPNGGANSDGGRGAVGDTGNGGASAAGSGTGGTGAASGTGGKSGTPRLGLSLMLQNPDESTTEVAGRLCPAATGVEWDIGAPIDAAGMVVDVASPTPTDIGATLADREEDAQIRCVVKPTGEINSEGGGVDPLMSPPNGLLNFVLNGEASASSVNVSEFAVYTPVTLSLGSLEGVPCTMSDVHEIAPGRFWGDIDCPALTDVARPDVACKATGTIAIENCVTE